MSNESTYDRLNKLAQDPSNFVSVTNCQSPENFEALESRTPNHQEINLDQVAEPKVQEASQFTLAKKKHKRKKSSQLRKQKQVKLRINYLDPLLQDNQPVLFEGHLIPMSCNALDPNWLEKYISGTQLPDVAIVDGSLERVTSTYQIHNSVSRSSSLMSRHTNISLTQSRYTKMKNPPLIPKWVQITENYLRYYKDKIASRAQVNNPQICLQL